MSRNAARDENEQRFLLGLGKFVRDLRNNRRLSIYKIAARADMVPTWISQLERGLNAPSILSFYRLAKAFDCRIEIHFVRSDGEAYVYKEPEVNVGDVSQYDKLFKHSTSIDDDDDSLILV